MKYDVTNLDFKPTFAGGEQAIVKFENGYSASVLRGGMAYTKNCTYEIAVLDKDGNIDYTTPITSDVLGYLSEDEANSSIEQISNLVG